MINCLKTDFYRLLKSKIVYILLAVLIGVSTFIVLINLAVDNRSLIIGKNFFYSDFMVFIVSLMTAVFASIFISVDFSSGMMKNYISGETSRTKIFFSKLIVCLTVCIIFLLIGSLYNGGLASAIFGYGKFAAIDALEYVVKFLLLILLHIAYVSIFTFMCFLIRNPGVTPVNIVIVVMSMSILTMVLVISQLLQNPNPFLETIGDYFLYGNTIHIATSIYPEGLKDHLLSIFLTGTVYTALFLPSAYMLFRFKDVK